ncbi:MAG: hypothetical protein GY862_14605 [Gammaproteobacteria bacterium]|nr:hypothetical protein [Gammaproteobacteria bacterium]
MNNPFLKVYVSEIEDDKGKHHTYCLDDGRIVFLTACIVERDTAQTMAHSLLQMAMQEPRVNDAESQCPADIEEKY